MSIEPFNRLVKLATRAFYDDFTPKGENQTKTVRSDNKGIVVVVLDALTRRQWVKEEDLAKDLKLNSKQFRKTLRLLEEEKLVTREHRRETAKGAKIYGAAIAATADGQLAEQEGEKKIKLHTNSYCCLDYAQIYDVVRYRLHRMKKKIKDQLENKNTVQVYVCPNCGKKYTALDAVQLASMDDEYFHCESCNGELVTETDELAAQEMGDGDDNARRRRREKLKDMLQKMEEQLKPLIDQLTRVKDLPVPEFGTLHSWELRANNSSANNSYKSSQGLGFSGTPMPFVGETKVEVSFSGVEEIGEDVKSQNSNLHTKVLPPWMIKQGMTLSKEQRGEVKEETGMEGTSATVGVPEDKKPTTEKDDTKNLQDEYVKAYYAALLQRQRAQEESAKTQQESSNTNISSGVYGTSDRQVGMKSKRDENEGHEDIEWEEDAPASNTGESYKVNDLNFQADASGDEEDDIDWEEG